jgi:hypothetical protein
MVATPTKRMQQRAGVAGLIGGAVTTGLLAYCHAFNLFPLWVNVLVIVAAMGGIANASIETQTAESIAEIAAAVTREKR